MAFLESAESSSSPSGQGISKKIHKGSVKELIHTLSFRWRRREVVDLTSVENVLEDQLRRLVVEGRDAREELEQTHAEGPPVHHEVWGQQQQSEGVLPRWL